MHLEQATVAQKITAIIAVFLMAQANITHAVRVVGENYELFIDRLFVLHFTLILHILVFLNLTTYLLIGLIHNTRGSAQRISSRTS